ncbi:protein kinase domain-containing protein [Roseateles sp.]|uniref:protein kinase domain-containing protein n=1 Tax=Roseateles sp. TaxID=1971397 RepID=UPI00326712E7
MKKLESLAERWPSLSPLLDEVLALPAGERSAWLDALPAEAEGLRDTLRSLLAANAELETGDFLGTLPKFAPDAAGSDTSPDAKAGDLVGPYRLVSLLGRGGMGDVWLADRADGELKRQVALKLPRVTWGGALAERLRRERNILATLAHRHIARLYDTGVDAGGRPYLALEYVEGQPIDAYCLERGLSMDKRLGLLLQVAAAVAHAHARLVVHRDLKPSNILVTADGEVRLLDFGIAKLLQDDLAAETQLTQMSGRPLTLDYASPEQIRGEPLGTASDVYSLGVVAYELLAEAKPYQLKRQSAAALEEAIASVDVRPASAAATRPSAGQALKGDLDAILNKALKKNPVERYATVDAFAQDIERHLANLPVQARPDALGYRARKFLRRNKLAAAASAAVTVAVVGGAGIALWQASVARDHARSATLQAELAKKEARRAQAVQGFLLDIFRTNSDQQKDPLKARGTTARELLDIGTARLDSSLRDAPEARVEVMETLGEMYYQLQLHEEAAVIETKRVEVLRKLHGADDRRVAEALIKLASTLHATTRRAEILPALEEARRILDAAGDQTSMLRGELLTRLAQRHQNLSYEKMKAFADEAVGILRAHAVANEDRVGAALTLAARARVQLGEGADAEPLYREALVELRKDKALSQVALAQIRTSLAENLVTQQKFDAALREYRETTDGALAALGPSDATSIPPQSHLAALLHAVGERAEARRLHRDVLRRVLEVKGPNDTLFTPMVRMDMGRSLLAEGRLSEALELVAAVNASNRRHYPGSAVLGNGLRTEATILVAMGRYAQARQLFSEGFGLWLKGTGSSVQASRHNRFHLDEARLDLALGDASAAIARLNKVAAPYKADGLPLRAEEIERDVLLAQAHLRLGAVERALGLAKGAAERVAVSSVRSRFPALDAEVQLQFGNALLRAGQPNAARGPIERALAWRTANDDASSPWVADAEVAWGQCLLALGDPVRSRAAAARASTIYAAHMLVGEHFTRPLQELLRTLTKA